MGGLPLTPPTRGGCRPSTPIFYFHFNSTACGATFISNTCIYMKFLLTQMWHNFFPITKLRGYFDLGLFCPGYFVRGYFVQWLFRPVLDQIVQNTIFLNTLMSITCYFLLKQRKNYDGVAAILFFLFLG